MADTDNTTGDTGQPTSIIANTIAGLDPPQHEVAVDAMDHEGGEADKSESKKDGGASEPTFTLPYAPQNGPLLRMIPYEVQNMIFKLCLTHPEDVCDKVEIGTQRHLCISKGFSIDHYYTAGNPRPKIREVYQTSGSARTRKTIQKHSFRNLAIMRTCQAVYLQAAKVLWGQQFTFTTIMRLQSFLFSNARLDLVRDIKILQLDTCIGINLMPAMCALLADKVKNLDRLDVDMRYMHEKRAAKRPVSQFRNDEEVKKAGVNLGFDIYARMHPWVTQVVRDKGIDRLMEILRPAQETAWGLGVEDDTSRDVHIDFRGGGPLSAHQQEIAAAATSCEIKRLIDFYEKKP